MASLSAYILVFVGAGLGGAARHFINIAANRLAPAAPYWGTVAINVIGSLLIGIASAQLVPTGEQRDSTRLFIMTGLLGGFTTFSAFSLEAATLWQRSQSGAAITYCAASVGLSLGAVFVGLKIGSRI